MSSIQDLPLMELFADRLSRVVELVFALCLNNIGNFPLVLVVDHNNSCEVFAGTSTFGASNDFCDSFSEPFSIDACSDVTI